MISLILGALALGWFVGTSALDLRAAKSEPSLGLALPPTPRPTPNPSPTTAPDGLSVYPLGPLPLDSRIVVAGDAGDERLLLLDVANQRVRLLAHFDGFGTFKNARVVELTTNATGDLLVICLHADGPLARLYFIRPVTAEVRSFTIATAENPRLSPDAATIAVSRNSADLKGLWLLNTSDGLGRRITTDEGRRATRAIQWSADGKRLAALIDHADFTRELVIVGFDGTVSDSLGPAADARWLGADLVFWDFIKPGPVSLYHGGTVSVSYATPPGVTVSTAALRPRSKDIAMRQSTQTTTPTLVLYDSATDTTSVKLADATYVIALWWSSDGTRLFTWVFDKDTTFVREVLTGETILTFCFRRRIEPPCGP